uniref:Uncharacterized protein n=1 Tax=Cucumis sativus TaxID=3659 RepID=A0A0A0M049_CUCSA
MNELDQKVVNNGHVTGEDQTVNCRVILVSQVAAALHERLLLEEKAHLQTKYERVYSFVGPFPTRVQIPLPGFD